MTADQAQLKTCRGCHQPKPLSQFYAQPKGRYGVAPRCKECVKAHQREYGAANRARNAASMVFEGSKACTVCGLTKPLYDFHSDLSRPDGHFPNCKACRNKRQARYHSENREAVNARRRASRRGEGK